MSQNLSVAPHSIKSEIRDNLSLSLPLISSQLIYSCSGFIATAMIAHLGQAALAASVLVSMIWASLIMLFVGILNAISILVSHQYGAKNYAAISKIMGQAYFIGAMITILIMVIVYFMPFLLRWSNQPAEVLTLAHQYMRSLLWSIPGLIVLIINEQFLTGANKPRLVLRISMLVVPVEIVLIYVLVFGKLGLPACGMNGVSYGFAITYTLTAIFLSYYLLKSKYYTQFQIFADLGKLNWHWFKELIRIGLPMGAMHIIEVSAFTVATFWIAQFGTTMLAAHQIVMQYLWFCVTFIYAMMQAVTVRVGHAVGRQDMVGVRYAVYVGVMMNFCCMIIIALAFQLFPQLFLRLDINVHDAKNALLVHDAAALLAISGMLLVFDNFRLILFGALRGLKDTHFPMYASLFCFWLIGLGSAYIISFELQLPGTGIWWGMTLGVACGAVLVLLRLQYKLKRVDLQKLMNWGQA